MYQFALLHPRLFAGAKESNVYEGVWYIFKGCFLVLYQLAYLGAVPICECKETQYLRGRLAHFQRAFFTFVPI